MFPHRGVHPKGPAILVHGRISRVFTEDEEQRVVTHQPAISFSISFQHPFNRAGGRTSNVRWELKNLKT